MLYDCIQMSRRVVIIGGFATGDWALEPVGHTAVELGLADDADIFTFPNAMRHPERIEKAAKGQLLLTHSAGVLAVANANLISPDQLVAYNGPEPRTKFGLVRAANRKTAEHAKAVIAGPHRRQYARVMASNAVEGTLHAFSNLRHIGAISRFSTLNQLATYQAAGLEVSAAVTEGDVFFPYDASVVPAGINVRIYPGGHDELLVDPAPLLRGISEQIR